MTDHKFTDDDVIKAYELCFTPKGTNETCAKCPFHKIGLLCKIKRDRAALALINRQKAEIERLQAVHADMTESLRLASEANKDMQAEIDRFADIGKMYSEIRAEAIKEFAERLKANMSNIARMEYGGHIYFCVGYDLIDTLVKEMTGDQG